ncbi:type II secretion system F family protein [Ilumatobacter sp.]|uniref:type II secretion system F family protein n=1 Tax=Ilumatobacter sp. TaxID=1967498 RepID=UPI003AF95E40
MRFVRRTDRKARQAARAALPDLIELVIIGVRAGLTPSAAFTMSAEHAAPSLGPALDAVAHEMQRGRRLSDALAVLPQFLGADAGFFTDALITADRYGLPLGPMLDQLGAEVRADRSRQAQRHARTLPVKLSFPLVVCTLPSFVLLAIAPAVLGAVSTITGS